MMRRLFLGVLFLGVAACFSYGGPVRTQAKSAPAAALTGRVSSQEEGPMEGVIVSAKKEGSTMTISVATDAKGQFSFPRAKLDAGSYAIRLRAVGYDFEDPGPVEVTPKKPAQLDLKLHKTQNLASQLTNAEWFMSWPGTVDQKMEFSECITCHTAERIARSHYSTTDFAEVIGPRMRNWASGSTPPRPMKRLHPRPGSAISKEDAAYLSTINLSNVSTWEYALKTLPRPKGRSTRMIVTEYDLPRKYSSPHDVVVAPNGMVWYCDFGDPYIGMLDPKTGKVTDYRVPDTKPGFDTGMNNLEIDKQGNVWVALFYQPGVAKFDPKTEKFQTWSLAKEMDSDSRRTTFFAPLNKDVDGKVWAGGGMDGEERVDLATGKWDAPNEVKDMPKDVAARPHGIYGLSSDSQNNLYELDIRSEYIVKVDAKTLKATFYGTPTFNSGPRRGHMDAQDRLWFTEHNANKMAMFDTKTEKFTEWPEPTPFTNPYDEVLDKNGEVWMGGMGTDRIVRLNPKTGETTEYLMPRSTNVRRVDVDNSTNPVTFWVGNNDSSSIIKLEPLD